MSMLVLQQPSKFTEKLLDYRERLQVRDKIAESASQGASYRERSSSTNLDHHFSIRSDSDADLEERLFQQYQQLELQITNNNSKPAELEQLKSERDLVAGEIVAFNIEKLTPYLRSFANEDIELFEHLRDRFINRFYSVLKKYSKETLIEGGLCRIISRFIKKIAHQEKARFYKRKSRVNTDSNKVSRFPSPTTSTTTDHAGERLRAIHQLIDGNLLSDNQRRVIKLALFEELSDQEIAQRLGKSELSVRSLKFQARHRLQKALAYPNN